MLSVVFTWDDNFKRHFLLTAPIFEKHSMTCTFYVMPGEEGYMAEDYKKLIEKGFEMGSHGYTHDDFTKMTLSEARENMEKSIAEMEHSLGVRPKTFAFPYHRYNDELLYAARSYFAETRNTLENSVRFDIMSKTTFKDMKDAVCKALEENKNIVFAGHASFSENDKISEPSGYEPIRCAELERMLCYLEELHDKIKVRTLAQACGR